MTTFYDDPTILDDDPVWRRVHPDCIIWDDNTECFRPTSSSFQNHKSGTPMSVILGKDLKASGRKVNSALAGHSSFGLVEFSAGCARQLDQLVAREPTEDEPAHAVVDGKKSKGIQRKFVKCSSWLIQPRS